MRSTSPSDLVKPPDLHEGRPDGAESLEVVGTYLSHYHQIVAPKRVIVFPAYLLERWGRLLTPIPFWILIAFQQVCYRNKKNSVINVSGREIARLADINPDTFWQYMREPGWLAWFVKRKLHPANAVYSPKLKRRPAHRPLNQYAVTLDTPLTPADQAHLIQWFRTHATKTDVAAVLAMLKLACKTKREQLFAPDPSAPAPSETQPLSILELVRRAFPITKFTEAEAVELAKLCEMLYTHLIPDEDVVVITHYYWENWLPRHGHGLSLLIAYVRDNCYHNPKTGEYRDTVWVAGGLQALARLFGIARPKTIGAWLRKASNKRGDCWSIRQFLPILEAEKGRTLPQAVDLKFDKVVFLEEPLVQADEELLSKLAVETVQTSSDNGNGNGYKGSGRKTDKSQEGVRAKNRQKPGGGQGEKLTKARRESGRKTDRSRRGRGEIPRV